MPSLSNSVDVYADKLYLPVGEGSVVDLAAAVAAKAEKTETYTLQFWTKFRLDFATSL